jgi:hypothetical protein
MMAVGDTQLAGRPGLPPALEPWARPVAVAFVSLLWWDAYHGQLAAGLPAEAPQGALTLGTAMATAGHLAGNALEAAFYRLWWRSRGARFGFWILFVWLVVLSLFDLGATALRELVREHAPTTAGWLAPLVGPGVVRDSFPGISPGLWAALGSLGLLVLLRIAATAWLQARALGRGLAGPLGLTLSVWGLTRLLIWWGTDLMRGRSPLP